MIIIIIIIIAGEFADLSVGRTPVGA